jgi:hypothetical protein
MNLWKKEKKRDRQADEDRGKGYHRYFEFYFTDIDEENILGRICTNFNKLTINKLLIIIKIFLKNPRKQIHLYSVFSHHPMYYHHENFTLFPVCISDLLLYKPANLFANKRI